MKTSTRAILTLVPAAMLAGGFAGCAGESPPPPPEVGGPWDGVAIRAYVGKDAKRVDFRPAGLSPLPEKARATVGTKATASVDGGPIASKTTKDLIFAAAKECATVPHAVYLTPTFWQYGAWFYFQGPPASCENVIAYSESMLCVAQKLSDIADAVAPITWTKPEDGPWTIPPQATADRVVAREASMAVLANLALTDMYRLPSDTTGSTATCSELYGKVSSATVSYPWETPPSTPYVAWGDLERVFGWAATTEYFDTVDFRLTSPSDVHHLDNALELVRKRMMFETHILRGASRLAEKLVRESVADDLAGAEKRRAAATDPLIGNRWAWGLDPTVVDPQYNNLGHALTVLEGRLDFPTDWRPDRTPAGSSWIAPACSAIAGSDVTATELLPKAYGPDLTARTADVPPTHSQRPAIRLLEGNGIVLPRAAMASLSAVRAAIKAQIVGMMAIKAGLLPTDPTLATDPRTVALEKTVDAVADSDLRYAAERTYDLYRLLVNRGELTAITDDSVHASVGGLSAAEYQASPLTTLGGMAFQSLPRGELAIPFRARSGTVQHVSNCPQLSAAFDARDAYAHIFQNPFAMAQTLYRRVGLVGIEGAGIPEVKALVETTKAEQRAFAGPGWFQTYPSSTTSLTLVTHGVESADVALMNDASKSLVLVSGPAFYADCVAGLRKSCPTDLAAHTATTSYVYSYFGAPTGADGPAYIHNFYGPWPSGFTMTFGASSAEAPVYAVIPAQGGVKGKVLGTLGLHGVGVDAFTVVSDVQAELLGSVMGFTEGSATCGSRQAEESKVGKSPAYCIKDVPRSLFVPLSNELTADGTGVENSWKHYLKLAREAAERADALGQKLIDVGLQSDLRREAAGEELGRTCGSYAAVDELTFKDGEVSSTKNEELNACISEPVFKIVTFGRTATAADARALLGCGSTSTDPRCSSLTDADVSGLDLVKNVESPKSSGSFFEPKDARCAAAKGALASLATGFDPGRVSVAAIADWATRDSIGSLAQSLSLVVEPDMSWSVRLAGQPVMQWKTATTATLWPGCLKTAGTCPLPDGTPSPLAQEFNEIFRGKKTLDAVSTDESKLILWRVEGVLWLLGAWGGEIPPALFDVPVPAANLANASLWAVPTVPIATVFGAGRFCTDGGTSTTRLCFDSNAEVREATGLASTISASYYWPTSSEIATWPRQVYSEDKYLHVRGKNLSLGPTSVSDPTVFLPAAGDTLSAALVRASALLTGLVCTDGGSVPKFWGTPSGGKPAWDEAVRAVAYWKNSSWPTAGNYSTWTDAATGGVNLLISGRYTSNQLIDMRVRKVDTVVDGRVYQTNEYIDVLDEPSVGTLMKAFNPTSQWSPDSVAPLYVNSYPPNGACGAAAHIAQALSAACALSSEDAFPVSAVDTAPPPTVNSLYQFGAYKNWLARKSKSVRRMLGRMYLENVPKRVAKAFADGKSSAPPGSGDHGVKLTKLTGQLAQIARVGDAIAGDLEQVSLAFDEARLQIQLAKIDTKIALKDLTVRRLAVHAAITSELAKAASVTLVDAWGTKEYVEAAAAPILIANYQEQLATLGALEADYSSKEGILVESALTNLKATTARLYTSLKENLSNMRTQIADTRALLIEIGSSGAKAKYEAAKASGAPFVTGPDGKVINFPVNVVLSRQYDITALRYKRALDDAKYLAYLARLSIEQRFGVRLEEVKTRVGTLDPPAEWADSVCSLSGVDYKALRKATPADAGEGAEKKAIGEFADQYIGDYVTKLENFVAFYNVEHPSHEGNDVAVLSLKSDLLTNAGVCQRTSPNLLYHSGNLAASDMISVGGVATTRGWVRPFCGGPATRCLEVLPSTSLVGGAPNSPAGGTAGYGVGWLRDVARTPEPYDGGVADGGAPMAGVPANTQWQRVRLEPGTYLLSWWDQARDSAGNLIVVGSGDAPGGATPYRVAMYDASWGVLGDWSGAPYTPATADASQWSARRSLTITVKVAGDYAVGLTASTTSALGSVALAGLQLEFTAKPESGPQPYVQTTSSREYYAPGCGTKSSAELQASFKRDCDAAGRCYYELTTPIHIDTTDLDKAGSKLAHKLAAGNHNYRHVDLALNLVGTGVRDCSKSPTPDCFGSGVLEYTLIHDAFQTPILGWDDETSCFNFGSASISHAKALAAERYITTPMGSADLGLIKQPSIEKQEFRGRPLDGDYRLRIWDSPALAWNRLEDVQLVFEYRYWSSVRTKP